tara:strand:+ start:375 stop:752 length:378 start_codon:yes stop_codon:yes gene_type:complete
MDRRARRDHTCNWWNDTFGKNLRYIRNRRRLTLQKLASLAGVRYQQIGKYELGVDQMSAYRLWQLSQLLKVKIKYFFDPTYIERMNNYHKGKTFHAAMPPELLDIDQLQAAAAEAMDQAEVQASL